MKKISFILLLFSAACCAQNTDSRPNPNAVPDFKKVKYGDGDSRYLHLYLAPSDTPVPVYIWSHANGADIQRPGSAGDFKQAAFDSLRMNGISAISWESVPQVASAQDYLKCRDDMYAVLDWVIAHAATYNLDATRIVTGGRSRGSLVSWKASHDPKYAGRIKGIYSEQLAGVAWAWDGDDPRQYITPDSPALFLTYITAPEETDNAHNPSYGKLLVEKYSQLGIGDRASIHYPEKPGAVDAVSLFDSLATFILRVTQL
jgi:hypothetical protein